MNQTKHTLKMKCGVTAEMTIDLSQQLFEGAWSPNPPFYGSILEMVKAEYLPWRDAIIEKEAERLGVRMLMVTVNDEKTATKVIH